MRQCGLGAGAAAPPSAAPPETGRWASICVQEASAQLGLGAIAACTCSLRPAPRPNKLQRSSCSLPQTPSKPSFLPPHAPPGGRRPEPLNRAPPLRRWPAPAGRPARAPRSTRQLAWRPQLRQGAGGERGGSCGPGQGGGLRGRRRGRRLLTRVANGTWAKQTSALMAGDLGALTVVLPAPVRQLYSGTLDLLAPCRRGWQRGCHLAGGRQESAASAAHLSGLQRIWNSQPGCRTAGGQPGCKQALQAGAAPARRCRP